MKDMPKIAELRLDRQFLNNTKLARLLSTRNIKITDDCFKLQITDDINNVISIWNDSDTVFPDEAHITPIDICVMDAIYTLHVYGFDVFTLDMIIQGLSGNKNIQCTNGKTKVVRDSLEKLHALRINIDCTAEYGRFHKGSSSDADIIIESNLLPLTTITAIYESNGKKADAYRLTDIPALYKYAKLNHQIIAVPAILLDTADMYRETSETIIIKRYVIKRVAQIVHSNKLSNNKISFEWFDHTKNECRGFFRELGYSPKNTAAWRKKKKKIVDIIVGTLNVLKMHGAITGFALYRDRCSTNPAVPYAGVEIMYDRKQSILCTTSAR